MDAELICLKRLSVSLHEGIDSFNIDSYDLLSTGVSITADKRSVVR
jgi:hypothetical protein